MADIAETAVNIKVVRAFRKSFPHVTGEKWSKDKGFYFVRFSVRQIKYHIVYTAKGSVDYLIKRYQEKHLPVHLRNTVKSLYYDHSILAAKEIYINRRTIYIIHLSNSANAITLRICDGEIDEIERLDKQ